MEQVGVEQVGVEQVGVEQAFRPAVKLLKKTGFSRCRYQGTDFSRAVRIREKLRL